MLGEGEVDFAPALQALADVGYQGGLHVELSRHSYDAPNAVKQAINFLKPIMKKLKKVHG
jgi:sugar phosphate isomerase/epimerase